VAGSPDAGSAPAECFAFCGGTDAGSGYTQTEEANGQAFLMCLTTSCTTAADGGPGGCS
jgi:hypothetical protein